MTNVGLNFLPKLRKTANDLTRTVRDDSLFGTIGSRSGCFKGISMPYDSIVVHQLTHFPINLVYQDIFAGPVLNPMCNQLNTV